MSDETQTPPDVPTPPMDSINSPQGEPVSPPPSEPAPVPELAPAPVEATPEPEQTPTEAPAPTEVSEAVSEPTPEPQAPPEPTTEPEAEHHHPASPTRHPSSTEEGRLKGDIAKARAAMQDRKRKKLDKIMAKVAEKNKITNDEVEKLLHVSDATATRYLEALKKENKIKQTGKTGAAVFYEKI